MTRLTMMKVTNELIILALLASFSVVISSATQGDVRRPTSIDHLQILVRHGERYPLFPVPEMGQFPIGGLTSAGASQERAFGERMGSIYSEYVLMSESNRMKSANEPRCIDSAVEILAGMKISNYSTYLLPLPNITAMGVNEVADFLAELEDFETQLPICVQELINKTVKELSGALPANVTAAAKLLFAVQVADSVDTLRQSGYTGLAFGLNISSCVPPEQKLFNEKAFAALSRFCMSDFCRPATRTLIAELEEFAGNNFPHSVHSDPIAQTLTIYGLTDVHVQGFLMAILPGETHPRPQFGGYIIFETRGDDVDIFSGQDVVSEPVHRATLNVYEVINKLRRTLA